MAENWSFVVNFQLSHFWASEIPMSTNLLRFSLKFLHTQHNKTLFDPGQKKIDNLPRTLLSRLTSSQFSVFSIMTNEYVEMRNKKVSGNRSLHLWLIKTSWEKLQNFSQFLQRRNFIQLRVFSRDNQNSELSSSYFVSFIQQQSMALWFPPKFLCVWKQLHSYYIGNKLRFICVFSSEFFSKNESSFY